MWEHPAVRIFPHVSSMTNIESAAQQMLVNRQAVWQQQQQLWCLGGRVAGSLRPLCWQPGSSPTSAVQCVRRAECLAAFATSHPPPPHCPLAGSVC